MRRVSTTVFAMFLLALAAGPGGARAEDEMSGPKAAEILLLDRATVLASPGSPAGLHEVLPGRSAPARLRWPLPEGPVVVLGLPHEDEAARQVALAFDIETEDLHGGYRIAAWRTSTHPIVVIMAADASALFAARFEFETDADMRMAAPGMRSLDFKKPDQEAGVAVRAGTRVVQPRYAYRAWAPFGWEDRQVITPEIIDMAAGARVNRLWFRPRDFPAKQQGGNRKAIARLRALMARARRYGIEPVLRMPMGDPTVDHARPDGVGPSGVVRALAAMSERGFGRGRAQHVALEFTTDGGDLPRRSESRTACEAQWIGTMSIEFSSAREIVIVPSVHADDMVREHGRPLRAADVKDDGADKSLHPRMRMAWSGPRHYATRVTQFGADARARTAGMPVILIERWAEPFQDPAVPYVPSLPRGREAGLADVLDGVVVMGRRGTEAMLESLWQPVDGMDPQARLDALCPEGVAPQGRAWASAYAARLAREDKDELGLVPWLGPMAAALAGVAEAPRPVWVLPRVGPDEARSTLREDITRGRRRHEAMRAVFAGGLPAGVDLLAQAHRGGIEFVLHGKPETWRTVAPLLRVHLRDPRTKRTLHARWTQAGWRVTGSLGVGTEATGNIVATSRRVLGADVARLRLDRFALGGDLHAGRVLEVGIHWGPKAIWPAKGAADALAPWVVGPRDLLPLPFQADD